MANSPVVVVGSGLAGLSCALELAEVGQTVCLLEAEERLGGRTASWVEDGMPVESGLHKFLGIYTALPSLLAKANIHLDDIVSWVDELAYWIPDGPGALLTAAPYQRPLRTITRALGNTDFLPTVEKAKLAMMAAAGVAKCIAAPLALDQVSIAAYARSFGVRPEIIQRVLSTTTQAVLFLPAEEFSAYAAFAPVVEGLKRGMPMRIGAFNGGMTELMTGPLALELTRRGGSVQLGACVEKLLLRENRLVALKLADGSVIETTSVVLATPLRIAQQLIRDAFGDASWCAPLLQIESLSSATVQLELDVPSVVSDRTNFSSTHLCCFAEQSRTTFTGCEGRLSAILYPPEKFLTMGAEEVMERVYQAADRIGLPLRGRVRRFRIVNHPDEFYAMRPGSEALRPPQATPIPGLTLCGDYTRQPFSASMEGAVLSGRLASRAVMKTMPRNQE
jgi:15-cis-phytoene desaturase